MDLYIWKYFRIGDWSQFIRKAVIDNACSVIWVRRYQTLGEFEVYVPASKELLTLLRQNELFITRGNDLATAMKIQKVELTTDPDDGDYLTISGKSCACIIGQRIVRNQENLNGTAQECVYTILENECIEPSKRRDDYQWRKMDVLSIKKTVLPVSTDFNMQYYGDNLLDVIEDICAVGDFGYKVEFNGEGFVFSLYTGVDRTIGQNKNPRVIFSEDFENLGQCTYTYDNTDFCNAVFVKGATKGTTKVALYWFNREECKDAKELCYNETIADASNVSMSTEGSEMSDDEFNEKLKQLGNIYLAKAKLQDDLNADVFPNNTGHYDLGDRVSIVNRYGITGSATITEITETEDAAGYRTIPTLGNWSVEKE